MKDMFCYIAANARHINLGFPRGSTLPDPNHVLEGEGKAMRHIKFGPSAIWSGPLCGAISRRRWSRLGRPARAGLEKVW